MKADKFPPPNRKDALKEQNEADTNHRGVSQVHREKDDEVVFDPPKNGVES